jgi:hypothetical protein
MQNPLSTVHSTTAPSLVSLPCRAQLNCQPSTNWIRVTLRLAVCRQSVRLGDKPLETHDHRSFFFQLGPCGNSPYVISSLTRRWVCLLWICLALQHVIEDSSFCPIYNCVQPLMCFLQTEFLLDSA